MQTISLNNFHNHFMGAAIKTSRMKGRESKKYQRRKMRVLMIILLFIKRKHLMSSDDLTT